MVLPIVGLDGSPISGSKNPIFSSGGTNNAEHLILTSAKRFQSAVVPGGRIRNPHHRQYLPVRHNAMKTLIFISFFLLCLSVCGQKSSTTTTTNKISTDKIYIPVDLDDCLNQLDKMFPDSIKKKIKVMTEEGFSGKYHLGFGMWMRNNWGLWKGSRLSKSFNTLGVYHPEDMTGIIFDSYYRKMTGSDIKLNEQIKFYHDYWEKAKKDDLDRKKVEFSNYNIGDTVMFNYKNGFVSKAQETKYDNDECNAKGIITEREESKLFIKVQLLDGCDKKGIVSYDNKETLILNEATKKLEKPKKRIITYMKTGQESWFNYSDWETSD